MRFPWRWTMPALVVIVATVVHGAVRYPGLPDRIPVHFRLDGTADRTVSTSVLTAFAPVLVQVVLTLILAGVAALATRRDAGSGLARGLLFMAACYDLAFYFFATDIWRGGDLQGFAGIAAAVCFVAGLVGLVVAVARTERADGPAEGHWRAGLFYVNPNDPALFVPKRTGLGWTLNLGRPLGKLLLGVLLGAPVVVALLSHL